MNKPIRYGATIKPNKVHLTFERTRERYEAIYLKADLNKNVFQILLNKKTKKYNVLYYDYETGFCIQKNFDNKESAMKLIREYERIYK